MTNKVSDQGNHGRIYIDEYFCSDKVQWKVLPTKANQAMEQAGADAARSYLERTGSNSLFAIYEAMAAAAPAAPVEQHLGEPECGHAACRSLKSPHPFCDFARSLEQIAQKECAICRDLGDQCLECEESEFVAWADQHFASADYRKTHSGVYIKDWMRHAFAAWQARASRQKSGARS